MANKVLQRIKEQEQIIQDSIKTKLDRGEMLNDGEAAIYKLTDEDAEIMDIFKKITDGVEVPGFTLKDFLATPQAQVLIPRVVIGQMRKAAEPMYLASSFFKKIRLKSGNAMMFPSIGVMRAYDVAEGQEINFGVSFA